MMVGPIIAIPSSDYGKHKGTEIRLKDFCNIMLGEDASFLSRKVKEIPKIQWVEKSSAVPVTVIMEDGSEITGMGESAISRLNAGDVVQFERFGFVRIDSIGAGKGNRVIACFAHH
jgi:glutamyl-tRNA synthetase